MEYQARLIDNQKIFDLPIEAKSQGLAILQAHRYRIMLQDKGDIVSLLNINEVLRHRDGIIEHQPVWGAPNIFFRPASSYHRKVQL